MLAAAYPRLLPLGDTAWTLEFGAAIDASIHAQVSGCLHCLNAARLAPGPLAAIVDVVPSFRSLTVHYRPDAVDALVLAEILLDLARTATPRQAAGRRWCLPACFDQAFAPDLAAIAEHAGLSLAAAISLLTESAFSVYMIGFMPGFPYMGGLPTALQRPRLASPRALVPAQSIALADSLCGVYPWASPGGWHLVGRTPVPLFVASEAEPALLAAGDVVRWQAVSRADFMALQADLAAGRLVRSRFMEPTP